MEHNLGRDLFWGPENLHMSGDHWDYLQGIPLHQILARYTVCCYVYSLDVCCNNYCWGHRLGLLTLARVLFPVAASFAWVGCRRMRARMRANKKKGESYKTWATPLRTTIRRMPEKMREQFCESGSTFGFRFGTQFWLQFWPPFFQFVL